MLAEILPVVTIVAAGATGVQGVWRIISGLLAKRAARHVLARKKASDRPLQNLAKRFNEGQISDVEVAQAAKTIEESLAGELSEKDLRQIAQGLKQANKAGERRYIEDLINSP